MSEENKTVDTATEKTVNTVTETENNSEKTFTQEDLNTIGAKENKRGLEKGQREALEALGFETVEQAQERLKQLKEFEDAQKTEQEKLSEQLNAYQSEKESYQAQIEDLRAENKALTLGVSPDSMSDAITLAKNMTDDEGQPLEIQEALEKVLEKYPSFKGEVEGKSKIPKWSAGNSTVIEIDTDAFTEKINKYK